MRSGPIISPTSGPPGTRVTIFAGGLAESRLVISIDGIPVPFIITSCNTAIITIGSTPGLVNIGVAIQKCGRRLFVSIAFLVLAPTIPPPSGGGGGGGGLTATSVSPQAGGSPIFIPGQTLVVTGTGFIQGAATVLLDGVEVPANVTSPTTLTFVIPQGTVGSAIPLSVNQNGVTTTPPLPINVPIQITSVDSGLPGQIVNINATNLPVGATVLVTFEGASTSQTVTSQTQLPFVIPLGTQPGVYPISVSYQGLTSTGQLTVNGPAPIIVFVSDTNGQGGPFAPNTPLVVGGANFVPGSLVTVNGTPVTTTYVSPTELRFTLPSNTQPGFPILIHVMNPDWQTSQPDRIGVRINLTGATVVGQVINIQATNLPANADVIVMFNGMGYPVTTTASTTQLVFPIPLGTPDGTYPLSVEYQGISSNTLQVVIGP